MNIEYLKVSEITPYQNNPRHNEQSVDKVAASIREFGFKVPVVIDKDNVIVCGHTRVLAAEKEGIDEIPCVRASELSEEQVKAFRLVDNKTQELSEWDWNKIGEELDAIENIDMRLMGFSDFVDEEDEDLGELPQKTLGGGTEIDLDSFDDEQFEYTCPCCGFKFNE